MVEIIPVSDSLARRIEQPRMYEHDKWKRSEIFHFASQGLAEGQPPAESVDWIEKIGVAGIHQAGIEQAQRKRESGRDADYWGFWRAVHSDIIPHPLKPDSWGIPVGRGL